jgi:hypothetical protein
VRISWLIVGICTLLPEWSAMDPVRASHER